MGLRHVVILLVLLVCLLAFSVEAQVQPSEQLLLNGKTAFTWTQGTTDIIELRGPVHIELDHVTLSADGAVVWLAPATEGSFDIQNAQISLIGRARLEQKGITREGPELFVNDLVRGGKIRVVADERIARDDSSSDLFAKAATLRNAQPHVLAPVPSPAGVQPPPGGMIAHPPAPTTRPKTAGEPLDFEAQNIETVRADDGTVAWVLRGGVKLVQRQVNGDYIELAADNAVLFTPLKSLRELQQGHGKRQGHDLITSAYLETDVKIDYIPARKGVPEQRLTGDRVFYEFGTDRAILTDAIIHTILPQTQTPIILRARLVRQLSQGEFATENSRLTNSQFALPSYSIAADRLYMRAEPTGDPRLGDRITYDAYNTSFQAFDQPFFFWPHLAGDMTEHGIALRGLGAGHDSDYGYFAETLWGLFETLGQAPPRDLDVNYRLDYYSQRGPAFGLNSSYGGGFVTDTTKQPLDFQGRFQSYFVDDHGQDYLGRLPVRVDASDTLRGQVLWEHQHFFPDGWQAQVRAGWVSDSTFMEQWYRHDFATGDKRDLMGYIKHQHDSEAITFGAEYQPSNLITTSENQQEQFEVEKLPEFGYYRQGEALLGDKLTLSSENTVGGYHYARSRDSLAVQGFNATTYSPGQPAEGYTGTTGQVIWRGDMREQLDFPFTAGPLRIDPYVMGRYTEYSNSPTAETQARLMAGAGTEISTQFWKTDPTAESEFLDIHQLRHVIQPEINVFTSAMNVQRNQVYVFDPSVDAVNDINAAQIAVHQTWETKRGGPGAWRNSDLFTLNVEVDAFTNKPPKRFDLPNHFRGLFFGSYPEESVPRDSVNADAAWRFSDNTVMLGDMSYNLDSGTLQTLAIGLLVRRDERLSYFVGNRYVAPLNSNITSVHMDYEFTTKYLIDVDQEFDFTQGKNVFSSLAIVRKFDTFVMAVRYFYDETSKQNGISFNLYPQGLGQGFDSGAFNTYRR